MNSGRMKSVCWIRMSWTRPDHGPRQLTDIYLLALAVQHEGRLVTFDTGIPLTAVRKATTRKLLIL
jgi:predicted nucleic acid-binding protein